MTDVGLGRLPALDGIRGVAALWVVVGHGLIISSVWLPVLSRPQLAVDLFMMISGILMYYHSFPKSERTAVTGISGMLNFWSRRFFRIAPLYYLTLVVALAAAPMIGEARDVVAAAQGFAPGATRYNDQSVMNFLLHFSFLFGFLPEYAQRTPIPDWSIGLEMQFYFFFPLIMGLMMRIGTMAASLVLTALCLVFGVIFINFLASFPQPTFLLMKLPVFLAGILVIHARLTSKLLPMLVAIPLAGLPIGEYDHWSYIIIRMAMAAMMVVLLNDQLEKLAGAGAWLRSLMSAPFFKWLGDVSYGVYLIHLPILYLISSFLIGSDFSPMVLAALTILIAIVPVYLVAHVCLLFVEQPGIRLGRKLSRLRGRKSVAPPVA